MNILEKINLFDFGIKDDEFEISDDNLIITKKNWDYETCLKFQELSAAMIAENKNEAIYIFCSHPPCLTLGRGLQKMDGLIDFDDDLRSEIKVPLYDISRGGGLTFHHPNQFVFYPIISLENKKIKVLDYMNQILRNVKLSLEQNYKISELDENRKYLGLWIGERKLASIGLCTRRFVTFHGLAVNLKMDQSIKESFSRLHPCGLPFDIYVGLNEVLDDFNEEEVFLLLRKNLLPI